MTTCAWDPSVRFAAHGSASLDANGLRQDLYQASDDFTLSGRPGSVVTLPEAGTARYTAAFEKGATTDDIEPRVQVLPNAGGDPRREPVDDHPPDGRRRTRSRPGQDRRRERRRVVRERPVRR